jgi:hypothetical protein
MTELDIVGLGIWGSNFSNWQEFSAGLNSGIWQSGTSAQPTLIPARERRRAPQSVNMAVEVMNQACGMAAMRPTDVAVVFSSSMGDMQITDYLCHTLSKTPRLVSPTRFHNSVHNAPTGYWSIATQSHAASSAISAFSNTAPMAFLEAAIQASVEGIPVLVVTQEGAAVPALRDSCPSNHPFSAALLLTPAGYRASRLASIGFTVARETVDWPELPRDLRDKLLGNPGARLLPLLAAIAGSRCANRQSSVSADGARPDASMQFAFPLASNSSLKLLLQIDSPEFFERQ